MILVYFLISSCNLFKVDSSSKKNESKRVKEEAVLADEELKKTEEDLKKEEKDREILLNEQKVQEQEMQKSLPKMPDYLKDYRSYEQLSSLSQDELYSKNIKLISKAALYFDKEAIIRLCLNENLDINETVSKNSRSGLSESTSVLSLAFNAFNFKLMKIEKNNQDERVNLIKDLNEILKIFLEKKLRLDLIILDPSIEQGEVPNFVVCWKNFQFINREIWVNYLLKKEFLVYSQIVDETIEMKTILHYFAELDSETMERNVEEIQVIVNLAIDHSNELLLSRYFGKTPLDYAKEKKNKILSKTISNKMKNKPIKEFLKNHASQIKQSRSSLKTPARSNSSTPLLERGRSILSIFRRKTSSPSTVNSSLIGGSPALNQYKNKLNGSNSSLTNLQPSGEKESNV